MRELLATIRERLLDASCASLAAALLFLAIFPAPTQAQLFGQRTIGMPLRSRSNGPPTTNLGLAVPPDLAAFQRPQRTAADFVGRNVAERRTFVGRSQSVVAPNFGAADQQLRQIRAQEIVRRRQPNVNVIQLQQGVGRQGGVYAPRLEIDFVHPAAHADKYDRQAEATVGAVLKLQRFDGITIAVAAGRATLRGAVGTLDEKKLVEATTRLEPGVESVDNQIEVAAAHPGS